MKRLSREGPLTHLGSLLSSGWTIGWWPARRLACLLFGHEPVRTDGYFLGVHKPVSARAHCLRCRANGVYPD